MTGGWSRLEGIVPWEHGNQDSDRIPKNMDHLLFKLTTADENVGADLRAATILTQEVAAQERCSHTKNHIFMNVSHELFQLITADESKLGLQLELDVIRVFRHDPTLILRVFRFTQVEFHFHAL